MRGMGAGVERVRAGKANMFLSPLFGEVFATVTGATVELAGVRNVEMPITQQVYRILRNEIAPRNAIRELMDRSLKNE